VWSKTAIGSSREISENEAATDSDSELVFGYDLG